MFKQVTTASLVVLAIISKASSSKFSLTLSTEQLGGDSTEYSEAKPLVVHVDKNSMSPEILEHLAHTSNIVFADLPELPQFINLREYESMKYATDDLLDQLINEQNLNLDSVKQNEKFSQIESILKEIVTEDSKDKFDEDKKEPIYEGEEKKSEKKEMEVRIEEPKHVEYPDKDIFWGTEVSLISTKETEKPTDPDKSTYSASDNSSKKHESTSTFETTSTSTFMTTSTCTSEEKHKTKSSSTSEYNHKTITSTSEHKNKTSSSISTKKSTARTSKTYSASLLRAPNNISNITVSVGYDNSSSFVMPTTLVLAFLLTVLLFVHEY